MSLDAGDFEQIIAVVKENVGEFINSTHYNKAVDRLEKKHEELLKCNEALGKTKQLLEQKEKEVERLKEVARQFYKLDYEHWCKVDKFNAILAIEGLI